VECLADCVVTRRTSPPVYLVALTAADGNKCTSAINVQWSIWGCNKKGYSMRSLYNY